MKSVIIIVLLCSSGLFAQVPGFQGKRFSVEGSLMFNTALSNYNENFNEGLAAFNKRFQGGVEYIIGRNVSLGGSYGIFASGLEDFNTKSKYRLTSNIGGLYLKIFKFRKKGAIAPYGMYGKIGLLRVMISGVLVETNGSSAANGTEKLNPAPLTLLNYGFGKQFIIKGRFIARVGADFGLNIFGFSFSSPSGITWLARKRVANGMFFNLEAGMGILIF
ncbi:MAG TPA: hypothetical protein VNW99_11355 [Cytophagaceae bacterium]|jgi:hypothetical protein|nr:hypothetical protein [Cytophagaceae bacterium]